MLYSIFAEYLFYIYHEARCIAHKVSQYYNKTTDINSEVLT